MRRYCLELAPPQYVHLKYWKSSPHSNHSGDLQAMVERNMAVGPRIPDAWREVIFTDAAKPIRTRIAWRPSLAAGARIEGPAVIEEPNATTLIHPGDVATVSAAGHLIIDVALAGGAAQ